MKSAIPRVLAASTAKSREGEDETMQNNSCLGAGKGDVAFFRFKHPEALSRSVSDLTTLNRPFPYIEKHFCLTAHLHQRAVPATQRAHLFSTCTLEQKTHLFFCPDLVSGSLNDNTWISNLGEDNKC